MPVHGDERPAPPSRSPLQELIQQKANATVQLIDDRDLAPQRERRDRETESSADLSDRFSPGLEQFRDLDRLGGRIQENATKPARSRVSANDRQGNVQFAHNVARLPVYSPEVETSTPVQPPLIVQLYRVGGFSSLQIQRPIQRQEPIQRKLGLTPEDNIYVHTTLGPIAGIVIGLLDGGEAYRVQLTGHYDQVYEVSHFIVDTSPDKLPSDTTVAKPIEQDVVYEESIKTKILAELDRLIDAKSKKIEVLERLKSQDSEEVSAEDEGILQGDEAEVSGQVTAMMLEADARRRGGSYEPFIVKDETGFQRFIADLQIAVANHQEGISST